MTGLASWKVSLEPSDRLAAFLELVGSNSWNYDLFISYLPSSSGYDVMLWASAISWNGLSKWNPLRDEFYTWYLANMYFAQKRSDAGCLYQIYKVNFVVQRRYATWQVQIEKKPALLSPFINTFNYFIGGVIISYNFGSYFSWYRFAILSFRHFVFYR